MTASRQPTVLFAGGGTGGHIFPNLAVIERLHQRGVDFQPMLLVSDRLIDRSILKAYDDLAMHALPAQPFRRGPIALLQFMRGYHKSKRFVRKLIAEHHVEALLATGGFVSAPAIAAAHSAGTLTAMVNLDAVAGRANKAMAGKADKIFVVYKAKQFPHAERIGLPLRQAVQSSLTPAAARLSLNLDAEKPTLFVTAGSQGAATLNNMMMHFAGHPAARAMLNGWQILHIAGEAQRHDVQHAYDDANLAAQTLSFCHDMGSAWRSATLAISRAGAGSVAEAWANQTPTIFYAYPYHKDQHQRHNAEPMVGTGGALLLTDEIEPEANLAALIPEMEKVMDPAKLEIMRSALASHQPPDGAEAIADWIQHQLGQGGVRG